MPIGSFALVAPIINEAVHRRPKTVLDLGIGFGFYGAALRQWLDSGVVGNDTYNTVVIGVEAWAAYRNPLWELYDKVWCIDIDIFKLNYVYISYFDFVIFSDVIEHFEKEDGKEVLKNIYSMLTVGGVLMVGTPGIFIEQGSVHGNSYETHRSLWTAEDFKEFLNSVGWKYEILNDGSPDNYGHQMVLVKIVK